MWKKESCEGNNKVNKSVCRIIKCEQIKTQKKKTQIYRQQQKYTQQYSVNKKCVFFSQYSLCFVD